MRMTCLKIERDKLEDALHVAKKHEQKYWDSAQREKYSEKVIELEARIMKIDVDIQALT